MTILELNASIKDLRELKRMKAEIESEIDAVQDMIKNHMTENNVDVLIGTDYKVSWKDVATNRFDVKAFKAEYPIIAEKFNVQSIIQKFILT